MTQINCFSEISLVSPYREKFTKIEYSGHSGHVARENPKR